MRWEVNPSRNEANARAAAAERWSQVHSTTVRSATENVRSPHGQVPKPAQAAHVPRTLSAPTDPRPSTVSSLAPARAPPGATALRVPPSVPVNPASSANASLVDAAVAGAQWRATAAEVIPDFETKLGAPKGPVQSAESKPASAPADLAGGAHRARACEAATVQMDGPSPAREPPARPAGTKPARGRATADGGGAARRSPRRPDNRGGGASGGAAHPHGREAVLAALYGLRAWPAAD